MSRAVVVGLLVLVFPVGEDAELSVGLPILTTLENCTDFSAALWRSSIEKIFNPDSFIYCHVQLLLLKHPLEHRLGDLPTCAPFPCWSLEALRQLVFAGACL